MDSQPVTFCKVAHAIMARTDLTPAAKLVYAAITDRIGDNGHAWPGLRWIATACGIGRTTAFEAVAQLEAKGLLRVTRPVGNSGGKTNRYELLNCSDSDTSRKPDVPKSEQRTSRKANSGRTQNRTYSDPSIQTNLFRPTTAASPDRELTQYFCQRWQERFGSRYPHGGVRDARAIKAVLRAADGDIGRARALVDRFIIDPDEWLGKVGHTLAIMPSRLAAYLQENQRGCANRNGLGSNDRYRSLLPS